MIKIIDYLVRSSSRKLNIISHLVRKQTIRNAIIRLRFCRRKISEKISGIVLILILDLINNYKIDMSKLYIKEVKIGKSLTLKRFVARARGKVNKITKSFSKIIIILEDRC
jgi:large subunit ribosomal protein L22